MAPKPVNPFIPLNLPPPEVEDAEPVHAVGSLYTESVNGSLIDLLHRWLLPIVEQPPKHSARRCRRAAGPPRMCAVWALRCGLLQIKNGGEATDE